MSKNVDDDIPAGKAQKLMLDSAAHACIGELEAALDSDDAKEKLDRIQDSYRFMLMVMDELPYPDSEEVTADD